MAFTAENARDIADAFVAAAQEINAYLDRERKTIAQSKIDQLSDLATSLLRAASSCTTEAVGLSIEEMENPSEHLVSVINEAKETLGMLEDARKTIGIAARLADLAAAIVAKDAGAVVKASRNLKKLV